MLVNEMKLIVEEVEHVKMNRKIYRKRVKDETE